MGENLQTLEREGGKDLWSAGAGLGLIDFIFMLLCSVQNCFLVSSFTMP
jgi:hypothetical protein